MRFQLLWSSIVLVTAVTIVVPHILAAESESVDPESAQAEVATRDTKSDGIGSDAAQAEVQSASPEAESADPDAEPARSEEEPRSE